MEFYTNCRTYGNSLLYRGVSGKERIFKKIYPSPSLFFASKKESKFKTFDGLSVVEKKFKNISSARECVQEYEGIGNAKVYGYDKWEYIHLDELYPFRVPYDMSKLVTLNFDIETKSDNGFPDPENANEEVISITASVGGTGGRYYIFGTKPYYGTHPKTQYVLCENEKDLLEKFLKLWKHCKPNIVTGWAVTSYDIPYIVNRISKILGFEVAKTLSPWNIIRPKTVQSKKWTIKTFDIYGLDVLDYMLLYEKYVPGSNLENNKLDTVANHELGTKKLDYSEYGTLHKLYLGDYQKFIAYNFVDVELVNQLDDKLKLMELVVNIAYDAKINFSDVQYQVRIWENIFYANLIKKNIVFPAKETNTKDSKYRGAYVKPSQTGFFDWVVSFDVNSLYPSLVVQNNISNETLLKERVNVTVEQLLSKHHHEIDDYVLCANGSMFNKTNQGFIPSIIEGMIAERSNFKSKQIECEKILEKVNNRINEIS